MPIYAYRCADCGHAKDVLQKVSDAPLVHCPACAKPRFEKQVTAAGFQLKGSGWYVTDFRDGAKKPGKAADGAADKAEGQPAAGGDAKPAGSAEGMPAAAPAPAAPAPTPPPAPPSS